ncbi:MAG TPA: YdcF family protein [Vicinamibacterales bacterium]
MMTSRSGRRSVRRLVAILLLLAVLVSMPLLSAGSALVVERNIEAPEAIIMLASHEWERLPAAAALARKHPEAVVLLTYPAVPTPYNCHLCDERIDWLAAEGVAAERVRVLPQVTNTYTEAIAARRFMAHERLTRLTVVTSSYHTRRALATFSTVLRDSGVQVGVVPASGTRANPSRWWLDAYDRSYVAYEWAALLKYRLQYGVPLWW